MMRLLVAALCIAACGKSASKPAIRLVTDAEISGYQASPATSDILAIAVATKRFAFDRDEAVAIEAPAWIGLTEKLPAFHCATPH